MLTPQAINVIIFVTILVQRHALGLYRFVCCRYPWSDGRSFQLPPCPAASKPWSLFLQRAEGSDPAPHARLISLILLWVWLLQQPAPYINSNRRSGRGIGDFMSPFISYNRGIILTEQTALDNVCQHTLHFVSWSDTSLPSSS